MGRVKATMLCWVLVLGTANVVPAQQPGGISVFRMAVDGTTLNPVDDRFCKGSELIVDLKFTVGPTPGCASVRLVVSEDPLFINPSMYELDLQLTVPDITHHIDIPIDTETQIGNKTFYVGASCGTTISPADSVISFVVKDDPFQDIELRVFVIGGTSYTDAQSAVCDDQQLNLGLSLIPNGSLIDPSDKEFYFYNRGNMNLFQGSATTFSYGPLSVISDRSYLGAVHMDPASTNSCFHIERVDVSAVEHTVPPVLIPTDSLICGLGDTIALAVSAQGSGGGVNATFRLEYMYPIGTVWETYQSPFVLDQTATLVARAIRTPDPTIHGCSTEITDTVRSVIKDYTQPPILLADRTELCLNGGPVLMQNLNYSSTDSYTWNVDADLIFDAGDAYRYYEFGTAGTQSVTLISFSSDETKCPTSDEVVINVSSDTIPEASLSLFGNSTLHCNIQEPETYSFSWGFKNWQHQDIMLSYCDNSFLCEIQEGFPNGQLYFVDVSNGQCTTRIYYDLLQYVAIDEPGSLEISIFPNPSNGTFHIHSERQIERIDIFDLAGRMVDTENMNGSTEVVLKTDLPNGIFLLSMILHDGNMTSARVVIDKP